jgi:glycosyltransferase involved in cell wall biosynthesis
MTKSDSFHPIVLILDWSAPDPIIEMVQGLTTVRWRILPYTDGMTAKRIISFRIWELRFTKRFERFCEKYRIVAINPHYPGPSTFSILRAISRFQRRTPLILSFHGTDVTTLQHESSKSIFKWKRLISRAAAVVVCSNDLGHRLERIFGEDIKYHVIYNGIDIPRFTKDRYRNSPQTARKILSVGKFLENKGHDVIINAFASISNDYTDVELILVGASGDALAPLKNLCVKKMIQHRVSFYLDIEHTKVDDFYRDAVVFILASKSEAFPIVLLEAGAFSLPVIATQVGGVPELLTEGINGLLVPPDEPLALAAKIRSILDHPDASREMGANLFQHVESMFTWSKSGRLYAQLIEGRTSSSI